LCILRRGWKRPIKPIGKMPAISEAEFPKPTSASREKNLAHKLLSTFRILCYAELALS
jgi:hypothetical protein